MAFHDLLIDCDLFMERQWVREDQVSNETRKRQRPKYFTIVVKLKNIANVQYLNVLISWKNLEYKGALETRSSVFHCLRCYGDCLPVSKKGGERLFSSYFSPRCCFYSSYLLALHNGVENKWSNRGSSVSSGVFSIQLNLNSRARKCFLSLFVLCSEVYIHLRSKILK